MTTTVPGPELVYQPDPHLWIVGPTEERPAEEWVPGATQAIVQDFGIVDDETRQYVERVLATFAAATPTELTERLLRWRNIADDPFVLYLGMVDRAEWTADDLTAYLHSDREGLVEPAVVTDVTAPDGVTVRRSIGYSSHPEGVVAGVRYVIDSGSPHVVALMHTATRVPGLLIEALPDLDDLARTVRAADTSR
ncbi:MAG: hypothetical protein ABWX74_17515 [Aeromicrobium sp.]